MNKLYFTRVVEREREREREIKHVLGGGGCREGETQDGVVPRWRGPVPGDSRSVSLTEEKKKRKKEKKEKKTGRKKARKKKKKKETV